MIDLSAYEFQVIARHRLGESGHIQTDAILWAGTRVGERVLIYTGRTPDLAVAYGLNGRWYRSLEDFAAAHRIARAL